MAPERQPPQQPGPHPQYGEPDPRGYQQPRHQNSGFQDPGLQQPGAFRQPGYQDPGFQQPVYQDPFYQQPQYQQPEHQQPGHQQPGHQQPGVYYEQQAPHAGYPQQWSKPKKPWWRRRILLLPVWLWIAFGGLVVALIAIDGSSQGDQASESAASQPSADGAVTPGSVTDELAPTPGSAEATAQPAADVGTRENPIPLGQSADVGGGWAVTVNAVNLNANDDVAAANEFNSPPPDGKTFVVAHITATFTGEGSDTVGVSMGALGEGTNAVSDILSSETFVVAPDPTFDSLVEVFSGGSVEGNIVLEVPSVDIDTLVLTGEQAFSFSDKDRKFFATR